MTDRQTDRQTACSPVLDRHTLVVLLVKGAVRVLCHYTLPTGYIAGAVVCPQSEHSSLRGDVQPRLPWEEGGMHIATSSHLHTSPTLPHSSHVHTPLPITAVHHHTLHTSPTHPHSSHIHTPPPLTFPSQWCSFIRFPLCGR